MCVMHVLPDPADDHYAVHEANYISLEDYAHELHSCLKPSVIELDYTASNVKNSSFVGDQQRRLDARYHRQRMGWCVTSMSKGTHQLSNERGK
ncbi:LOW QUALITY PROTEIN: hypothetical protein PHMEG_00022014 [Phytophthora megakarya]|uniref:Uncharacterized protein n=1 Tax=Phytophthora megakarya TaxID=4795 RepID=A0A225VK85_9STRA|nr:LOW QUALITY PROTEIN: hypothetical protein PHMEG_00022014 [Phytophthora megakarya]